jgi:hypothetical protein
MDYLIAINKLKTQYPDLVVIEVWENVLFLRMGKGRCVFAKKNGTEFENLVVGQWIFVDQGSEVLNKREYRKLAKKVHPDLAKDNADRIKRHEKFQLLNKAYEEFKDGDEYSSVKEIPVQEQEWYKEMIRVGVEEFGTPF